MTFAVKLNTRDNPPAFKDTTGARWEFRCGWCDSVFQDAHQLVRHVCKERAR